MMVKNSITVGMARPENDYSSRHVAERDLKNKEKAKLEKGKSIFAGDLNVNQDSIVSKKIETHKKAMKVILDTFNGETKLDDEVTARHKRITELGSENSAAEEKLEMIGDLKLKAKEFYEITDDSPEQKDLELMQKQQRIDKMGSKEVLTEEENQRLNNMGEPTEYQKTMLGYDNMENEWNNKRDTILKQIDGEKGTIKAIEQSRLGSHLMVDANKEAAKIVKNAGKEIIGMLVDETKDSIDKDMEEKKDEIEKIEEKKQEEEAKTEAADAAEPNQETAENMSQVQEIDEVQNKLEIELKNMMKKIPAEDIKGIAVDTKA